MSRRITFVSVIVGVVALAALAFSTASAQEQTVDVELGDFYIDMPTTIEEGTITFALANVGAMPHTISIEGNGVNVSGDVLSGGQGGTLEVELAPGTYVVYCPIPGHREAGMEVTLTVTASTTAEPTATTSTADPTATTSTANPTATTSGGAATATSLPGVPQTGAGGAADPGIASGTLAAMLLLVAAIALGAFGVVYRGRN